MNSPPTYNILKYELHDKIHDTPKDPNSLIRAYIPILIKYKRNLNVLYDWLLSLTDDQRTGIGLKIVVETVPEFEATYITLISSYFPVQIITNRKSTDESIISSKLYSQVIESLNIN